MSLIAIFLFSALASAQTQICLLDPAVKSADAQKLTHFVTDQTKTCKGCKVISLSLHDHKGALTPAWVTQQITVAKGQCEIIQLGWNRAFAPDWIPAIEALQAAAREGRMIVGTPGAAAVKGKAPRLSATLLGRVQQDVFIIGELGSNGKLKGDTKEGADLFTALRPPSGFSGAQYSASLFTSALANHFADRSASLWRIRLSNNKASSGGRWPSLSELFEDKNLKAP